MTSASTLNSSPPRVNSTARPTVTSILRDPSSQTQTSKSISLGGANTNSLNNNHSSSSQPPRESLQARVYAQINGFSSERERATLMRTISQLKKEDNGSPLVVSKNSSNRTINRSHNNNDDDDQTTTRPFHHSELASPPCYSTSLSKPGFSRLSLDIRRPRGLSTNDITPYNQNSSFRKRFTRSQLDISSPCIVEQQTRSSSHCLQIEGGSPSSSVGELENGINQARPNRMMSIAASKLHRLSLSNLPKLSSTKQFAITKKKSKGKQKEESYSPSTTNFSNDELHSTIISTHDVTESDSDLRLTHEDSIDTASANANCIPISTAIKIPANERQTSPPMQSEDDFSRSINSPSTITVSTSSSSEDGNNSMYGERSNQSSTNSSRQNSDFPRHNVRQSSLANVMNIENEDDHSNDEDDDGIRWSTPSASLHPFTNPFEKINQQGSTESARNRNPSPTFLTTTSSSKQPELYSINQDGGEETTKSSVIVENQNAQSQAIVNKKQEDSWKAKAKMSIPNIKIPFALSSLIGTSTTKEKDLNGRMVNAIGIDEEQAYIDRIEQCEAGSSGSSGGSIGSFVQDENNVQQSQQESEQNQQSMYINQSTMPTQNSNDTTPTTRRTRSSHLAHLPRLNSSRGKQGFVGGNGSNGNGGSGGMGGSGAGGGGGGDDRRNSDASQLSEEPPSDDEAVEGHEDEEGDSDSEGSLISDDEDQDLSGMPGSLPPPITANGLQAHRMSRGPSAVSRNHVPSGISLPPAPTFLHMEPFSAVSQGQQSHLENKGKAHAEIGPKEMIPGGEDLIDNVTTPKINQSSTIGNTEDNSDTPLTSKVSNPSFTANPNRENWTQFSEDTPGWLPTPRATGSGPKSNSRTPGAGLNEDSSYFNIQPNPAQNVIRDKENNANIPPPSPSIITRSRAQSSASFRSMGLSSAISSRELPPMPPIVPLNLRNNQRSRSPNRKIISPIPIVAKSTLLTTSNDETSLDSTNEDDDESTSYHEIIEDIDSRRTTPRPATSSTAIDRAATASPRNSNLSNQRSLRGSKRSGGSGNGMMNDIQEGKNVSRPNLYKQESRSLIDLNSPARKQIEPNFIPPRTPTIGKDIRALRSQSDQLKQHSKSQQPQEPLSRIDSPAPSIGSTGSAAGVTAGSSNLRRRRSMYEVGAAPPPYTTIAGVRYEDAIAIIPREEEGKESLPNYQCSVHIEGYLPRKMEFSSPGVQAKDRSWKRQYFVLHGTCLRIYRTDMSNDRSAVKGEFGKMSGAHVHMEPMNEDGPNLPSHVGGTGSRLVPTDTNSTNNTTKEQQIISPIGNNNSDANSISTSTTNTNGSISQSSTRTSQSFNRSSQASIQSVKGSESQHNGGLHRKVEAISGTISHSLHRGGLVKQYTLQGAESGLAADYLKRRHVVRVRAEGEQFLLQTRNDRHVVDWIEAFQAATNIAMDLERRPMPKFITLPRRRRRRNNNQRSTNNGESSRNGGDSTSQQDAVVVGGPAGGGGDLSARELADIAEARRRSLLDSNASSSQRSSISGSINAHSTSSSSRTPNPPRPLGLPGDETPPNPSAAFERMLRDEEEAMAREDAGYV